MKKKLRIRVVSPWFSGLETDEAILSVDIPPEKADALLCDWGPSPELFTFPRRKVWYCCEPQCQFDKIEGGSWPAIRARLAPHEFLCHNHPDERYRVPHITHFEALSINGNSERKEKGIAIISNHGGSPWRRHPDVSYRNRFATSSKVDLYGRTGWKRYRARRWSLPGSPRNYLGELPGDWPAAGKRDLMATYKVAVCLENMREPHYFTEKLVEAVCAGCIPVYRAEASVSGGVLEGAFWVDPTRHGNDPTATLAYALGVDAADVREQNSRWLMANAQLHATHYQRVFERISTILSNPVS